MKDKLQKTCLALLQGETKLVCAVSGGADSVALLYCLRDLPGVQITAAHFNHGLRGAESDADEAFVRALCRKWNVPLTVGKGDVAACAAEKGMSVEEAARHLRYAFLLRQDGIIATAHHGDDQLETVLLNLLRGTGLTGLCAMPPRNGRVIRPMLELSRAQIEAFLADAGIAHREDSTNTEDDALRNRLRHHVVPLLKEENPNLVGTVGRMTALLRQDEAYLQKAADALLQKAKQGGGYDCRVLSRSELRCRAIRKLLKIPKPSMTHVRAVEQLICRTDGSGEVHLPGMTVRREYETVYFGKETAPVPEPLTVDVSRPGSVQWGRWNISWQASEGEMVIRSRQTGDIIHLPNGSKSVKKLMIDEKIPVSQRSQLPIFVKNGVLVAVHTLAGEKFEIEERVP